MYCSDNKGFLMPAVRYLPGSNGIELNSGSPPTGAAIEWPGYLITGNYVATPVTFGTGPYSAEIASADYSHSVFFCPNGLQPEEIASKSVTKWDPAGAYPQGGDTVLAVNSAGVSTSNSYYECWYSCNGCDNPGGTLPVQFGSYPFNCNPIAGTGGTTGVAPDDRTMPLSALNPSSQIPLIYDGSFFYHENDDSGGNSAGSRINARHNNWTTCNILFADGHVEGLQLKELPGGIGTSNELGNGTLLDQRNPSVKWMLPPSGLNHNYGQN
jgi:prepilin-type processing-associated H-X9-DG protein